MKPYISCLVLLIALQSRAQYNESATQLKAGIGYSQEFPGLGGYTALLEYNLPVISSFRAGLGSRFVNLNGNPRTHLINEYTRAETIDFNFYWSPLASERQVFSLGIGYSFSFYHILRALPVTVGENQKVIEWIPQESNGRSSGFNLFCEYAYHFEHSPLSAGIRGAWYKAYINGYFVGPVIGIQF